MTCKYFYKLLWALLLCIPPVHLMVALQFHCWNILCCKWFNNSWNLMSRHMLNVIYGFSWVCLVEVWEKEFDPIMVILRTVYRRDVQSAMDRYSALWVATSGLHEHLLIIVTSWWPLLEPLLPGCIRILWHQINRLFSVISVSSSVKMWARWCVLSMFFALEKSVWGSVPDAGASN